MATVRASCCLTAVAHAPPSGSDGTENAQRFRRSPCSHLLGNCFIVQVSSFRIAPDRHQRTACADLDVSTIFAACDMGTAKFEPENPDRMAKFTPITLPVALNTGPPDPPEVVCAS